MTSAGRSREGERVFDVVDPQQELNESLEAESESCGGSGPVLPQLQIPLQGPGVDVRVSHSLQKDLGAVLTKGTAAEFTHAGQEKIHSLLCDTADMKEG